MSAIIDHPSPNHSPRKPGTRVDTVLLHHTATPATKHGDASAVRWLRHGGGGVSAHYVVGHSGTIWRLVPEHQKAWHAGKGRLPWETCEPYDFNHRSIGVEVVNPGDGVTPFTEAQYEALAWLVPDIVHRLGRDVFFRLEPCLVQGPQPKNAHVYVLGHRDTAPGRKTDPADNFDWGRIRAALANAPVVG